MVAFAHTVSETKRFPMHRSNNKKVIFELLFLVVIAILFYSSLFWDTRLLSLHLWSDYDAVLPIEHYIFWYFNINHKIPLWNPYVGAGIPVIGDSLSLIINPIYFLLLILFNNKSE